MNILDQITAVEGQLDELRRQLRDRSDELAKYAGELAVERKRTAVLTQALEEKKNVVNPEDIPGQIEGEGVQSGTD